jgi:AbrB family looped-hinge helix DNA binding protein
MIATAIREKGQVTLPQEIREAAALETGDQVEWKVQDGEIRGRKLVARSTRKRIFGKLAKRGNALVVDLKGLKVDPESIVKAIREDRESR